MKYRIIIVHIFNQNCILIWCAVTNEGVIIDPGGEIEKIYKEVKKLKINIVKILLTHGHIDHVGGAIELKRRYGVPILGPHKRDKFLLGNLYLQYHMLGMDAYVTDSILVPDVWLKENDTIKVGCEIFHVLHCPGHSPGHIVFWNKIRKFIVMGDVLFQGSIGRSDLPGGDFIVLINSIKNKLLVLGDDILFIPGHGANSTLGYERMHNSFLQT